MSDDDKKLRSWNIVFRVIGTGSIEVEAETEDEALNLAIDNTTIRDIDWDATDYEVDWVDPPLEDEDDAIKDLTDRNDEGETQ